MADERENIEIGNTLKKAFTASSEDRGVEEKERFGKLIDAVMKTETGRETLKALSKLGGYSFVFETGDFGGLCDSNNRRIVINPNMSFDYNCTTIVHEATHAIQDALEDKENTPPEFMIKTASYLRRQRAIEADATAHENAFIYECKDILPGVYQQAEQSNLPMFKAYVDEMEKSGDKKAAMQASFAAWYECDGYRDFYDGYHKKCIDCVADWGKAQGQKNYFKFDYSTEHVLEMCLFEGKPYMTPEFLNSGKAYSISIKGRDAISEKVNDYAKAVGVAPDTSIMTMNVRDENGNLISAPKTVRSAPDNVSTMVVARNDGISPDAPKAARPPAKQSLMSRIQGAQKSAEKRRLSKHRNEGR